MGDFMKKPCEHCPYRRDVKPFLTPARGEELAYAAENPYNTFHCHKTLEHDEDAEGYSETFAGEDSKICAGFLSMQHAINGATAYDSDGFTPAPNCYEDTYEMADAYAGDDDDDN